MKPNHSVFQLLIVFIIILFAGSCKDDGGLTHVTDFERKIYNAINNYRVNQSLPSITLQFLMVDDAQNYSKKMAAGLAPYRADSTDEVMIKLNTLKNNLGGDGHAAVVQFSESENADSIVNRIIRDPLKKQVIRGNFNQTGVGTARDAGTGKWYATILFIHIP